MDNQPSAAEILRRLAPGEARISLALAALLAALGPLAALAQRPLAHPGPAPAPTPPPYVVVQGEHPEAATPSQKLTVLCPPGRAAYGVGYTALVRRPQARGAAPAYLEGGLEDVRSMPDARGGGWQVQGVSPDAAGAKLPWKLVVRVVCARPPA